ncbi:class I SAM-dependent RNA methyltransferase [Consotaella aegiceratis]|uniref:class I SAM-dependent RNA methyltransferase n=1 Tax=Consotaella aegiceratis TaxID=3097961 RepID=UPI002F4136DC
MAESLRIESLGAKGDGVAAVAGGPVYVPFTLPGELVEIDGAKASKARPSAILEPSAERREPPCPHFGACGGCDLQHASDAFYRAWKRQIVVDAFARRGIQPPIGDLVACPPASRRRAVFSAVREGGQVRFGFFEVASHRLTDLDVCLVVMPEIAARLPDFKALAGMVLDRRRPLRMAVTATPSGLDIALADATKLSEKSRQAVVAFSLKRDFARVSIDDEVVVEARKPLIEIGGIALAPPPGAFLQAVAAAEEAMADQVLDHFGEAKEVADLFAGVGTFALRLARHARVMAVESDAPALAALDRAVRGVPGLKPMTLERRDLFRRPLTAKELSRFDGVVFDPPRAGAEAQARELARSTVRSVVAVSCNPATLARDAHLLIEAGYRLRSVTPIDQFLWSHHVEAVAAFAR